MATTTMPQMLVGDPVRVRRSGSAAEIVAIDANAVIVLVHASGVTMRVAPDAIARTRPWWFTDTEE